MSKFDQSWSSYAKVYDPIQVGSIDGTHTDPHDNGIVRACNASYHPNRLLKNNPERTLFIGRLDKDVMEKDLENLFSKYGTLENVTVVRDIVTGFSKRYAFVEFRSRRDCHLARSKEQKTILKGKEILVEFEFQNTLPGWIPRRLGGGFGGRKESGQLRFGCVDRPWKRPIQVVSHSSRMPKSNTQQRNAELERDPLRFPRRISTHTKGGRKEHSSLDINRTRNEKSCTPPRNLKRLRN
ncbi:U11/U12 small nuclear ribonucleoprotein 35 kDa protein [Daphnia magna]|uniref:RRM domain-containing protein n=1 Tax=Daphnia magna TaxID=35525 RepID=A0ABQ9ZHM8_9CRUS|nr:U11/U12 small nuclear ribonucleoprotein 35 kDa protein [Daphnia magna]XP_032784378.2 U11/U12 small nuclear ribonucleoprotein 35 kDa protein [Daphnia magna]KAK4012070.1 hypothetical protein OUZ56_021170 [Daphnia magna]